MKYRNTPPQPVKFDNFVSLGYFCSVASELERIGLRSCSGPFDWQASRSFKLRIKQIDDGFVEFFEGLTDGCLQQKKDLPHQYFHPLIDTWLVHDFNASEPLSNQLEAVIKKYRRRVANFYDTIKQPTLFLYYIYGSDDAIWIKENYAYIIKTLKRYNDCNEIIFIANNGIGAEGIINLYIVEPDKNDIVARRFLNKLPLLRKYLNSISAKSRGQRLSNKIFYYRKEMKKKWSRVFRKKIKKIETYRHYNQYCL